MKIFYTEDELIHGIGYGCAAELGRITAGVVNESIQKAIKENNVQKYIYGGFCIVAPPAIGFESIWIDFYAERLFDDKTIFQMNITEVILYDGIPDTILDKMNKLKGWQAEAKQAK